MKKIFIVILTTAFLYSVSATSVFNVQGMSCPVGCAPKVTNAALEIKGVEKCDVNFEESKATIVYDNEKVTEGVFTYVAIDKDRKPRQIADQGKGSKPSPS